MTAPDPATPELRTRVAGRLGHDMVWLPAGELRDLLGELDRRGEVERVAAAYVMRGLCGSYSLPGGITAANEGYVALVEAVRTNPNFRA